MGRAPCCSKVGLHRGPWTSKEDSLLTNYITSHGEGHWRSLPKQAGLLRCGKSCRLRWMNYLRPDIKRGNITAQEDDLIIRLHSLLGNRWSLIAGRLPGRTDNEIKNYWNTRLSKKITPPNSTRSPSKNSITIKRKSPNKKANSASSPPADLEIIETKHMVHQPKPVRLGSVRNISSLVQTSESNNNNNSNNSTNIECSSYSSENNMNLNSKYYYYYNNNSNSCSSEEGDKHQVDHHVADLEVAALYNNNNNNNIGSSNDIIGAWDDDDDVYNGLYGDQAFNAVNNNNSGGVWEKLYEEYLQLTSTDGCEVESQHPHEASLFI